MSTALSLMKELHIRWPFVPQLKNKKSWEKVKVVILFTENGFNFCFLLAEVPL